VWCLFVFHVVWRMRELMGRQTAVDLLSLKVKDKCLVRGNSGKLEVCLVG